MVSIFSFPLPQSVELVINIYCECNTVIWTSWFHSKYTCSKYDDLVCVWMMQLKMRTLLLSRVLLLPWGGVAFLPCLWPPCPFARCHIASIAHCSALVFCLRQRLKMVQRCPWNQFYPKWIYCHSTAWIHVRMDRRINRRTAGGVNVFTHRYNSLVKFDKSIKLPNCLVSIQSRSNFGDRCPHKPRISSSLLHVIPP